MKPIVIKKGTIIQYLLRSASCRYFVKSKPSMVPPGFVIEYRIQDTGYRIKSVCPFFCK